MVSGSLLGGIFDGIVNWIAGLFDTLFQSFIALVGMMAYLIIWSIAQIIKIVEVIFKKLLGIDTDYTNIQDPSANDGRLFNDIISQFLFSEPVKNVFIALLVLSIVLLFIFTFIAIVRSEFTLDTKNSAKGPIIGRALKSLAMFVIVPVVAYTGLIVTSVIGKAVWGLFTSNESGLAEQVLYLTAHGANKVRNDDNFAKYINGDVHNPPWSVPNNTISYINNNAGIFKVETDDVQLLQRELSDIIDTHFRGNFPSEGNTWQLQGISGAAGTGVERDIQFIKPTNGDNRYSYWDIRTVGYFYKFIEMNFLFGFLAGLFMLYIMFKLCSQLIKRIFEIVILILLAAPMHSIAPLDNGNAAKNWQQNFIRRVIMILGPIFAVNMYFVMMAALEDVDFSNTLSIQHSVGESPVAVSAGEAQLVLDYDGTNMTQYTVAAESQFVSESAQIAEISGASLETISSGSGMLGAVQVNTNIFLADYVTVEEGVAGVTGGMVNLFFYFLFALCGLQVVESAGALLASILGTDDVMKDAVGGINKTMQGFTDPDKMMKTGMKLGSGAGVSAMARLKRNQIADYGIARDQLEKEGGESKYANYMKANEDGSKSKGQQEEEQFVQDNKNDYANEEEAKAAFKTKKTAEFSKETLEELNTADGDKDVKARMEKNRGSFGDGDRKNFLERGADRNAYFATHKEGLESEKDDPSSYLGNKQRAYDSLHGSGLNVADAWKGTGAIGESIKEMSPFMKDLMGTAAGLGGNSKSYKFDEPKEWKDAVESANRMWYGQNRNPKAEHAFKSKAIDNPEKQNWGGGGAGGGGSSNNTSGDDNSGKGSGGGGGSPSGGSAENVVIETGNVDVSQMTAKERKQFRKDAARANKEAEENMSPEERSAKERERTDNFKAGMQQISNARPTGGGRASNMPQGGGNAAKPVTEKFATVAAPVSSGKPTKVDISNLQTMINELMQRLKSLQDGNARRLEELFKKINTDASKVKGYSGQSRDSKAVQEAINRMAMNLKEFEETLKTMIINGLVDKDGNPTGGGDGGKYTGR